MSTSILPEYLEGIAQYAVQLLLCIGVTTITYIVWVHLLLFKRFLQFRLGKRIQPDGSRAVIITGATSGFGLATAKRLLVRGFTVFACYYNDREVGYKELLEIQNESPGINSNGLFLIRMDVRSGESILSSTKEIERLLDSHRLKLHCLLNNAGIMADSSFELLTDENICNVLNTNLVGMCRLTKQLALRIIKDKGRVVNVSSCIQVVPCRSVSIYGSTKAAISYFTGAINEDLKPYGVGCYKIYPGNIMLQTNLALSGFDSVQKSLVRLSDEERQVYKDKIGETQELLKSILRARLDHHSKNEQEKLADFYKFSLPDASPSKIVKRPSWSQRLLTWIVCYMDGSSEGHVELEQTGAIDCFESAITLLGPPSDTYAGNKLYQFYAGPLVEFLPPFLVARLYRSLISSIASR